MIQPPTEAASRERQWFILFLGATNFVCLGFDLHLGGGALVATGRLALSCCLFGMVFVLRWAKSDRVSRGSIRAAAALGTLSYAAIVAGTGGPAGPYFNFFGLLPIVFTVAVPDDVAAVVLIGVVGSLASAAAVLSGGLSWEQFALCLTLFFASTGYAVAGTFLHCRVRQRELEAQEERRRIAERLLEAERRSSAAAAAREQVLSESEERFRVAFHASHDALCVVRLEDGVWMATNQGFTRMTGWTEGEVVGRTGEQIGLWTDAEFRARMYAALEQRGEFHDGETRFRTRSGALIDCTVSAQVMLIAGKPHLLSVTRDITASKRLHEQFLQAQKMEAVGRVVSGVAHDFNNLLMAVLGGCDFLLEGRPSDEELREEVQQIREAGKRGAELIRQLMAFSRKSTLRPVGCDLNDRIRGIQTLLRRSVGEHIELDLLLSPEPLVVTLDPSHFDQILMNLAVNARDAMSGAGRLRLATRLLNVAPGGGAEPWVELLVEDTGSGMSPEVQAQIFEPFFTTKDVGKGTGLGLSTVFGIVQQLGGHIAVESAPGKGTTFRLLFRPASQEKTEPRGEAAAPVFGSRDSDSRAAG